MGICIISNKSNLESHMSCGSFNYIRRCLATSFDVNLGEIYGKLFSFVGKYPNEMSLEEVISNTEKTKAEIIEYKMYHEDSKTQHVIEFLMDSDTNGRINGRTCKVLKPYIELMYKHMDQETYDFYIKNTGFDKMFEDACDLGMSWK